MTSSRKFIIIGTNIKLVQLAFGSSIIFPLVFFPSLRLRRASNIHLPFWLDLHIPQMSWQLGS
jgi:hypothetical protein